MTLNHGVAWGELYDFVNDPDEMENLWDDAAYHAVKAELMETLARRQMELVDRSPLPTAVSDARPPRYRSINWSVFRGRRTDGDYADYGPEVQIAQFRIDQ